MQFKQPEILYFLFALVVPILVHLFQLRRFKTEYFTNVRMLASINLQTRKSAKIKKWLLLCTRILLFACVILAFAQPYFSSDQHKTSSSETCLILDNSYSMQAKGKKGELLQRSVEEILTHLPEDFEFSLITANETYWNVTTKSIRKELQQLTYSPVSFDLDRAIEQVNARPSHLSQNILLVTDGRNIQAKSLEKINAKNKIWVVTPQAEQKNNCAVDSVYLVNQTNDFYTIAVRIKKYGDDAQTIPLAVYNQNNVVAKTIVSLNSASKTIPFTLPKKECNGSIQLTDQSLTYDNTLFFSLTKPKVIPVLSIGEPSKSGFLRRIYTADEFAFTNQALEQLDYNELEQKKVIICNELTQIPAALQSSLKAFTAEGGTLIVIPSDQATALESLDELLGKFGDFQVIRQTPSTQLITQIAFNHPVYKSAFEKIIRNFDYPKTKTNYWIKSAFTPLLSYANQQPFLLAIPQKNAALYVFTSAINPSNSNFQQSPLIVPTFYNMATLGQPMNQTYTTIGKSEKIVVEAQLEQEEILTLKNGRTSLIPQQQIAGKKVLLNCGDKPEIAGNYSVNKGSAILNTISFNYDRNESDLNAPQMEVSLKYKANSIESVVDEWKRNQIESDVWKWFVLLALLFVILELLIQKFVS